MLNTIVFSLLFYLALAIIFLALNVGIGWLLHKILPSVELGMSILISVVATAVTLNFYGRILTTRVPYDFEEEEGEEEEGEEGASPKTREKVILYPIESLPSRRRKRRKRTR